MKSIIIFRHGKSDWTADFTSDHDRPLAPRGVKSAQIMGKYLSSLDEVPDLVITSSALRAKTTAEIAMEFGHWKSTLIIEPKIYGGSCDFLLQLVQKQMESVNRICLVGHEPVFSLFISKLTGKNIFHFPTASMAKIDYEVNSWKKIKLGEGILDWLQSPKDIQD